MERVVQGVAGVADYRLTIDRVERHDVVQCEVVADSSNGVVAERVREAIRDGLRFACEVTVVASLPPGAERFVDQRTWD